MGTQRFTNYEDTHLLKKGDDEFHGLPFSLNLSGF